jgi:predicted ABC-type transport system involved in lysophospholipase L1 biosynthesis ATPase subunit
LGCFTCLTKEAVVLALEHMEIVQGGFRLSADIKLRPHQTTAILGPSGGGKSTLLTALAGFVEHSGDVSWQGKSLKELPPAARPVSMLFQEHNLFPHLSIAQNVGLGCGLTLSFPPQNMSELKARWRGLGWRARGLTCHAGFLAGSAKGRRWRGLCCGKSRSGYWMSLLPPSGRGCGVKCWSWSRRFAASKVPRFCW